MNLLLFPSYFIPHTSSLAATVLFYLLLIPVCPVVAGTFSDVGLPSYTVKFLGNNSGYPTVINDNDQVVGWVMENGGMQAFISTGGMNARLLPLPVGTGISRANDINNHGVVVGFAGGDTLPQQAVAWYSQGQGYKRWLSLAPYPAEARARQWSSITAEISWGYLILAPILRCGRCCLMIPAG